MFLQIIRQGPFTPSFSSRWMENFILDFPVPSCAFNFLPTSVTNLRSVVEPSQSSSRSIFLLTATSTPDTQLSYKQPVY